MDHYFNIYTRAGSALVQLGRLDNDTISLVVIVGALQQQGLLPEGLLEIPDDYSLFLEFPIDRSMRRITSDRELSVAADLFQQNRLRRMVVIVTPGGSVPAYPHI